MMELLPCPFCGGRPELQRYSPNDEEWVECLDCSAQGPTLCGGDYDNNKILEECAIEVWNLRAC